MTLLRDIARELAGMFVADGRLSVSVLALVGLVAAWKIEGGLRPLLAGALLLAGCVAILIEATVRETRRRR